MADPTVADPATQDPTTQDASLPDMAASQGTVLPEPKQPGVLEAMLQNAGTMWLGLPNPARVAKAQEAQAYRQQLALQHFQQEQRQAEADALKWTDKAFEAQTALDKAKQVYAAAKQYGSQDESKYLKDLQDKQAAYDFTANTVLSLRGRADNLAQQIPHMISGIRPTPQPAPTQGAGKGKSAAQLPTMPPSGSQYEMPSYAGATEQPGATTSGPVNESVPPQPRSPTDEWQNLLENHYGFHGGMPVGNSLQYFADAPGQAEDMRNRLKAAGDALGIHDMPVSIVDRYGMAKEASANYQQWTRIADAAVAKASFYQSLTAATKDENQLKEMLAYATAPQTADPETAANLRLILSTTADQRLAVVNALVKRYDDRAKEQQGYAEGFKPGADQFQNMVSPGITAPPPAPTQAAPAAGPMTVDDFANNYALAHGWMQPNATKIPTLTAEQRAELGAAIRAWQAKGGGGGR